MFRASAGVIVAFRPLTPAEGFDPGSTSDLDVILQVGDIGVAIDYASGFDQSYDYGVANGGEWLRPTSIVSPRFVRFTLCLDF